MIGSEPSWFQVERTLDYMISRRWLWFVGVFSLLILMLGLGWAVMQAQTPSATHDRPVHDWPTWRYDANRSAESPEELPRELHLQWVRTYPKLSPVWENPLNQDLMQFDRSYEPVVMAGTLFIGSNTNDCLIALKAKTGEEKWRFYMDGPLRLPTVAVNGRVYCTSDDGNLYCVDGTDGKLLWKFRGGPSDRKVLGNERLISTWPARGGPVVHDGVVYFASGIWPFMGTFIYALDAETGDEIWVNDSMGSMYMRQPHNSPSYAGIAPQGSFVVSGDKLLVPCGRSVPACLDRLTGKLEYYHLAKYNKTGGAFVSTLAGRFVNYHRDQVTSLYDLDTGDLLLSRFGRIPVMTEDALYCMGTSIRAFDFAGLRQVEYEQETKDKETQETKIVIKKKWVMDALWDFSVDASGDLIKAGSRLYAGGKGKVSAVRIPQRGFSPVTEWSADIQGTVSRIIAANGMLFVVTLDGRLYAFGSNPREPMHWPSGTVKPAMAGKTIAQALTILNTTDIRDGYCLVAGSQAGGLAEALVGHSDLRIIVVDPDVQNVDTLRRRWNAAGFHGKRLNIQAGDLATYPSPPYLASLIVLEAIGAEAIGQTIPSLPHLYDSLRPYGGTMCLSVTPELVLKTAQAIRDQNLINAEVRVEQGLILVSRQGSLPGAASWTHQYGDVANTVKSDDQRVKLPLGLLWFGGSTNTDVLPRHGHGPPEQIINGRLFIEGMDLLSARDVYTGRVLWKRSLPGLDNFGVYFDSTYRDTPLDPAYNQVHIPGANARGTNFVATSDAVYVLHGDGCVVLDAATGETQQEIRLPSTSPTDQPDAWGYLGVWEDSLIAGAEFVRYAAYLEPDPIARAKLSVYKNYDVSSSKELVVMNRHSGALRWKHRSELGLRHSAIAVGAGRVFCVDAMPPAVVDSLTKRELPIPGTSRMLAFDLATGNIRWQTTENVFGTWLGYSEEHDVLVQAGRPSRDMLKEEPSDRIIAYKGADGTVLWDRDHSYNGPCILHGRMVITDRYAYDLLTGERIMRTHALTDQQTPWSFQRNYGCNYAVASEHLLTFRSAAAGFFDLVSDGGTGNFGGFKSGCTSNLIVADGVLNAPDYTRTCSCSYPNQTSLALVHDPDVEIWTDYPAKWDADVVQNVGLNLGAPGDRKADNGRLWLEYPRVGGPSPDMPVGLYPIDVRTLSRHSSRIQEAEQKWVAASAIEGVESITVTLFQAPQPIDGEIFVDARLPAANDVGTATPTPSQERSYTVRLYFAELEGCDVGERVFDIIIQGKQVLADFDTMAAAGGRFRETIREFTNIHVWDDLNIRFRSKSTQPPLINGIEIRAEQEADAHLAMKR